MRRVTREPRVVIVGYGWWGRACHAYLLRGTPGLVLHGVVTRSAEKRAQAERDFACRTYPTPAEAFADPDVDLVVLSTPSSTHAGLAVQALQAGKHVVTEKAMCLNLAECDRMVAAATASDGLLTVFQNRRLDGDFLTIRSLMAAGELGDLRWLELAWQGPGAMGNWRGQAGMGGGRLYDLGTHLLDQLLALVPDPVESVYCRKQYDYPEADIESEALVVVTFASGRTGLVDCSGQTHLPKPRYCIHGSKATFVKHGLDPQEAAMKAGNIDVAREDEKDYGRLKSRAADRAVPTLPGRWRTYYENLRDVLTRGAAPIVPLAESRRVMAVLDAALRSVRTGQVVRF